MPTFYIIIQARYEISFLAGGIQTSLGQFLLKLCDGHLIPVLSHVVCQVLLEEYI